MWLDRAFKIFALCSSLGSNNVMFQVDFSRKEIENLKLGGRRFIRECSYEQHCRKQMKKDNWLEGNELWCGFSRDTEAGINLFLKNFPQVQRVSLVFIPQYWSGDRSFQEEGTNQTKVALSSQGSPRGTKNWGLYRNWKFVTPAWMEICTIFYIILLLLIQRMQDGILQTTKESLVPLDITMSESWKVNISGFMPSGWKMLLILFPVGDWKGHVCQMHDPIPTAKPMLICSFKDISSRVYMIGTIVQLCLNDDSLICHDSFGSCRGHPSESHGDMLATPVPVQMF